MKTFAIALVVLGLALAAAPAGAQDAGQTSYTLKTAESKYWRTDATGTTNNPTLIVPASTQINVTAINEDDGVHNLRIGGASAETKPLDTPDQEITYTFTSPATGDTEYICTIHSTTMKGVFRVAGSGGSDNGGGDNDTPGFGLVAGLLVLAGVALYVRRQ